jgi:uncharacterized membrane protein YfcA
MPDPVQVSAFGMCLLAGAAFFAGVLDSTAGGGGLVSLPATLLAGVAPQAALGTGKFMAVMGGTASFITYAANGAVAWRRVAVGVCFSLAGSRAGTHAVLWIDKAMLGKLILALLPLAALITFTPARATARQATPGRAALYVGTPVLCAAVAFYDGFFGPGSGSFMLLGLHRLLGLELVIAAGTAKAFILASNCSSLSAFIASGNVCYAIALPMALANVAGHIAGSRLALRKGPTVIRRMLALSLGLLFCTLLWRSLNA